ncbi:hypothetical protein BXT86_01825 [candidate division WOR-3 bacterium 4484_100]|uniref:Type II secretion system protein GspG C-terminal domain-containing protein n=1 Tax=candidate division WOR-3 bacterium 4484_100 TaxID=1936077 RepID=A0A1V4QHU6_UNCW3|nr:MAG: hypothetical protein BXT86_01825 [candidate division WOR-3 bacterium 4484_100]
MKEKGFTLIEIMVVIVIIGILSALAIPNYQALKTRAKEASVKSNMHTLQMSVEDFCVRCVGLYPGDLNTTIIEANPAYTGSEPNICVADAYTPPYGNLSILPDAVKNPFSSNYDALKDGLPDLSTDQPGTVGYQASNTLGDDPLSGNPWHEAPTGSAIMYRIAGLGAKGIILIVSQVGIK